MVRALPMICPGADSQILLRSHAVAETDGITGTWDSIHVAEVSEGQKGKESHYKLTTTIILQCQTNAEGVTNDVGGYKMQVVCLFSCLCEPSFPAHRQHVPD